MIQLVNISKKYEKKTALDNITLEIPKGVCYGLIGPNGAGKSTLMKILTTVLDEFNGSYLYEEKDVRQYGKTIRQRIGYVPQDITLYDELSAWDNMIFFGNLYGMKGKELKQRIEELLHLVGLHERRKEAIKTYSGGMKRRINIACSMIHQPEYIFMDEPTVGVDPQSRKLIFDIIQTLKKNGVTILYSSHYMEEIELLCDRVALMDKGKIVDQGDKEALIKRYTKPSIFVDGQDVTEEMLAGFGMVRKKGNGFVIETENGLKTIQEIAKQFEQQQVSLNTLELYKRDLEDVFFELTGSTLRD